MYIWRILFYYIFICRYKGCSHDTSNDSIELISVSVSSLLDIPVLSTPSLYCWDTVYCKIINNNSVTLGTGVKYFGNITGKREEEERGRADFVSCILDYLLLLITSKLSAVVAVVQCIDCIGIDHCRSIYVH